jgi:hypothetical protein
MPFPPNFDHIWDLTQPPDTQLLNQGALDFRSLKDDIMQRMSLLSGTLANRPSPETANATWGGNGFGLTYLSTDTGQTFQWNGNAWIDITNSVSNVRTFKNITGNTPPIGGGLGQSITIPAGTLAVGSVVEIFTGLLNTNGGSNLNSLNFGGTIIGNMVLSPTINDISYVTAYVTVLASNSQVSYMNTNNLKPPVGDLPTRTTPAENIANPIVIHTQAGAGSALIQFDALIVKVY